MKYESVILELLERIQTLEESYVQLQMDVQKMRESFAQLLQQEGQAPDPAEGAENARKKKITEEMIAISYSEGVRLFQSKQRDIRPTAEQIVRKTGMNRNSAIMYLYALVCMLSGTMYKRGISREATALYFQWILRDFGPDSLQRAVDATKAHAAYRRSCGYQAEQIEALCREYQEKLDGMGKFPLDPPPASSPILK